MTNNGARAKPRLGAALRVHVLDTTMLYSPNGGGVVRYLLAKRRWLTRRTRMRHSLLVPGERNGMGLHGETFVHCRPVPGLRSRMPLDTGRWSRLIAEHGPDVVEVGDPGPVAIAAFRARRVSGTPVIAFCHTDLVRDARSRYGSVAGRTMKTYACRVFGNADRVLAPSEYMKQRLIEWGVHDVAVCPLGVDAELFHPSRRHRALRERLGLPRDARLCVFAGRFAPAKNMPLLVDAFRRLGKPYHLLLIGSGPCLPPLPANVTVLPFERDPKRLAAIVGGVDAFVQAGERESFGLALVEAMACGVPIVAAADGAAPEIVTPDCGVLVRAGSASDLAAGVAVLYDRDREALGDAARARAERNFGWDRVFRGLLQQYATVVHGAAARVLREQIA